MAMAGPDGPSPRAMVSIASATIGGVSRLPNLSMNVSWVMPAFEQIGQRARAFAGVEDVVLVDAHPRQRAALVVDLVAQARQLLFARQQRLALGKPAVPGHDRWFTVLTSFVPVFMLYSLARRAVTSPPG